MSTFLDALSVKEFRVDSDRWELLSTLTFEGVTVPVGFVSDGATIPWPFTYIWPRWGRKYRRPAVLHDYLYKLGRAGTPHPLAVKRLHADRAFYRAMRDTRVSLPVRVLFWLAVRAFGPRW